MSTPHTTSLRGRIGGGGGGRDGVRGGGLLGFGGGDGAFDADDAGDVGVDEEEHEGDEEVAEGVGDEIDEAAVGLAAEDDFEEGEEDVTAVKYGKRKKVEEGEVDAEETEEAEGIPEVVADFGVEGGGNQDGAAEGLGDGAGLLGRNEGLEDADDGEGVPTELGEGVTGGHPGGGTDGVRLG